MGPHIANCISKSTKALNAIKLIKRFFIKAELIQLITSNFYSILYYNSEIWQLPVKNVLKQKLLSASAKALKVCIYYPANLCEYFVSIRRQHKIRGIREASGTA